MKYLLLCVLLGCSATPTSTGIAAVSCPTAGSTLTYASFGSVFVSDNCLSCHASKERPTLATQGDVQANRARILQVAVYTDSMPQNGDLTVAEREMFGEWLACGAP